MEVVDEVNAKKQTFGEIEALALLEGMQMLIAARGKQVVRFDLRKDKPSANELKKVLLGPTGNLRAPTLKVGKTLLVGFDEATYREVLR